MGKTFEVMFMNARRAGLQKSANGMYIFAFYSACRRLRCP